MGQLEGWPRTHQHRQLVGCGPRLAASAAHQQIAKSRISQPFAQGPRSAMSPSTACQTDEGDSF